MELSEFLEIVSLTPLLEEGEKAYYRQYAASFSHEYRTEIAGILRKHEQAFMAAVKAKDARRADEAREAAQASMTDVRAREQRERVAEAGAMKRSLSTDLAYL